jgi:hypothetical protein
VGVNRPSHTSGRFVLMDSRLGSDAIRAWERSRPTAWCNSSRSWSASRWCWLNYEAMSSGTATSLTVSVVTAPIWAIEFSER